MKPAPPVTSSRDFLGNVPVSSSGRASADLSVLDIGRDLPEHTTQALAPVHGSQAEPGQGALIEHAVRRPTRGRRVVSGSNRGHADPGRQKSEVRALLSNGHRKVVPARNARVGPVMDTSN